MPGCNQGRFQKQGKHNDPHIRSDIRRGWFLAWLPGFADSGMDGGKRCFSYRLRHVPWVCNGFGGVEMTEGKKALDGLLSEEKTLLEKAIARAEKAEAERDRLRDALKAWQYWADNQCYYYTEAIRLNHQRSNQALKDTQP